MANSKKISMKLLIDKTKHKVYFAEAEKECVDFFFHILSLPLGAVVGYLTKPAMVGSLGSLYGSLESLGSDYLQENVSKESLLNPKPPAGSSCHVPLMTLGPAPPLEKPKGGASTSVKGYVKGVVTYMITDDLSVKPMSTVSCIALLSKFNVQDVRGLEEREVCLDMDMGVELLRASLMSKTVLTDVFLGKKCA